MSIELSRISDVRRKHENRVDGVGGEEFCFGHDWEKLEYVYLLKVMDHYTIKWTMGSERGRSMQQGSV